MEQLGMIQFILELSRHQTAPADRGTGNDSGKGVLALQCQDTTFCRLLWTVQLPSPLPQPCWRHRLRQLHKAVSEIKEGHDTIQSSFLASSICTLVVNTVISRYSVAAQSGAP